MRIHARDIIPMAIALGALLLTSLMVLDAQAQPGPWTGAVADLRARIPADARTPKEAYFSIERPFAGDLTMTVRVAE